MFQFSPLTQRRLANFRANRRGYWSLRIFLVLYGMSLCSEFIANDKPLLMQHRGSLFTPVFFTYTERELGGQFDTEAQYEDPFVQKLVADSGGWMLWPPIRFSYTTIDWFIDEPAPAYPARRHWLGTDDGARDVVARLLYGFRLSVSFGLVLTLFASIIGVATGAVQGYYGGLVDLLGQSVIEIWAGLPILFLLIILSSLIEPSVGWLLLLLVMFSWMTLVGVVRAEFLRTRKFDHVRAARALGVGDVTIMYRHVLPNAMVATLTYLPFILNGSITTLTALDFLGFGLPPGSPSLGELLAQGKSNIQSPWLGLTGFATLAVMLTLLIFVGEAVRDAFDPRRTAGIAPMEPVLDPVMAEVMAEEAADAA
jgi:microcin C transport system permease protein